MDEPWRCSWGYSLPLHLCNVVVICCFVGVLYRSQLLFEIAYFWGLPAAAGAFLTPDLPCGWPSWDFIGFFWGHAVMVVSVATMLTALEMRPRPGSVLRMIGALLVYGAVVGALDAVYGWNYGFLREPPWSGSIIDYMGRWPWYLLSLLGLSSILFVLLDLPWWRARQGTTSAQA